MQPLGMFTPLLIANGQGTAGQSEKWDNDWTGGIMHDTLSGEIGDDDYKWIQE